MRNILSLKPGTPILGSEIIDWCEYNIENNTSRAKVAKHLKNKFPNIQKDVYYSINLAPNTSGCGQKARYKPIIIRCEHMNIPDLRKE